MILICGIAVGFLLLVAVYAIPVAPIAKNVILSAQALDGSWETGEIPYEQLVKGYLTTQLDNTTDATMLMAAVHENDQPLLRRAINVSAYAYQGMDTALIEYARSGTENLRSVDSARYWLGFLIWLKPLLCVFSYMDIRALQMALQLLLLGGVLLGFHRRGLSTAAPAFVLSLLAITPAITGFSMQFSSVYTLYLVAALVLLYCPRLARPGFGAAAFFLMVGMATSYFDYLTYPIATFGVPFLLHTLLHPSASRKVAAQRFAVLLGAWLAGYFGMWAGKWVLATLLSGDGWFLPNLLAKVTERSSYTTRGDSFSYLAVLRAVLGIFAKKAYVAVALLLTVCYAVVASCLLLRRRHGRATLTRGSEYITARGQGLSFALTGVLPFAWYAMASNHSINHAFFTSRALVVSLFALGLWLLIPLVRANIARPMDKV